MQRLRFQKQIFSGNITYDGNEFGTNNLSLIFKLNEESDAEMSALVIPNGMILEKFEKMTVVTLRGIEPRFTP